MTPATIIFLAIYGFFAALCGWCLCRAADKPLPPFPKCDDSVFEPPVSDDFWSQNHEEITKEPGCQAHPNPQPAGSISTKQ